MAFQAHDSPHTGIGVFDRKNPTMNVPGPFPLPLNEVLGTRSWDFEVQIAINMYINPSLFYRQMFVGARDGNLPEMLSGIHVTLRTPMPAVLFQAFMASVMVAVGDIDQLIDAFSASAWTFYGLAIGAVIIMRITHEDMPRSFEVS